MYRMSHDFSNAETALISDTAMVLTLDFNAVTHSEPCARGDEFCFMSYLEQVVREHPGVDQVISRSWPGQHSLEPPQGFVSTDIASRVVAGTPSSKELIDTWLPGSHHLPHRGFASDLSDLLPGVDLRLPGHVHDGFDYQLGRCRVQANPAGYILKRGELLRERLQFENQAYCPALTWGVSS
jgi:hypothetical protein